MSYYVFNCRDLLAALDYLRADNAQGEYYITDCPGVMAAQGKEIRALPVLQPCEAFSINTPDELAAVEATMRQMGAA
jgi:bifunctional UDP-N-acetylglucosamine pyrophosphorylase/glucosamine-1-phosphate N-acetyltransferase/UDP-N-acetylglucosamine pyrophosphorylase